MGGKTTSALLLNWGFLEGEGEEDEVPKAKEAGPGSCKQKQDSNSGGLALTFAPLFGFCGQNCNRTEPTKRAVEAEETEGKGVEPTKGESRGAPSETCCCRIICGSCLVGSQRDLDPVSFLVSLS